MSDLHEMILEIARAGSELTALQATMRGDRIIAEFASARDAKIFAGLKREAGEEVTVTPGVNLLFAVRTPGKVIP